MADGRVSYAQFREALKRLHREFPRPKREQETVGDWALRLFEHQFLVNKLITDFYAHDALGEIDEVPANIPEEGTPSAKAMAAVNWLLSQERNRRV